MNNILPLYKQANDYYPSFCSISVVFNYSDFMMTNESFPPCPEEPTVPEEPIVSEEPTVPGVPIVSMPTLSTPPSSFVDSPVPTFSPTPSICSEQGNSLLFYDT